ncbi:hypothetical protein DFH11DRAFT_1730218 [Phellopilus nigrolimitatus]|nr:hypothetical protein DFH11DRAFT_1730218 [Phellopilus nigrolimitatus]
MPRFRDVLSKLKIKKLSPSSTSTTLVVVTIAVTPPTATNGRRKEKARAKTIVQETAEFLYVGLGALADSADAFPPLKSAVGGLKNIVDLLLLLERIDGMCELLEKAIPDVTNMSASFQTAVIELDLELSRIAHDTERGIKKPFFKRLNHLRRHEGELRGLRGRLENARNNFELSLQLDTAHGAPLTSTTAKELAAATSLASCILPPDHHHHHPGSSPTTTSHRSHTHSKRRRTHVRPRRRHPIHRGMSTVTSAPHRRLSSRRGSHSAPDPYGLNADAETARGTASRITILPVRAAHPAQQTSLPDAPPRRDRSSWGSAHSASSAASATGRGRVSFAFTSFTPLGSAKAGEQGGNGNGNGGGRPSPPGSPTARSLGRSSSNHSLDRLAHPAGRPQSLTPQQICDLATTSIAHPPPASPPLDGAAAAAAAAAPTPFLLLSDEQYLPFLDRPGEVAALFTTPPTARLMGLLAQTFPADLRRAHYESSPPPASFGADPARWSFAELARWLQTVDRDAASDRVWVAKMRQCVLARSELIWSRLKVALGVPPELEEDEEDYEADEEHEEHEEHEEREEHAEAYDDADADEREAWLEPIFSGDTIKCVGSPLLNSPETPFGYGGRDGGMASIGEGAEDETDAGEKNGGRERERAAAAAAQAIQGLRLSTAMLELHPPRSAPVSPAVPARRALSTTAAPDDAAAARRREAVSVAGAGRVRRSEQQERGTGAPLFPSSFATLTMGPSLVANNPALRSGPRRAFRPGVPLAAGRRGRFYSGSLPGGWDTDGNDYALSLGSGSERSFVGR